MESRFHEWLRSHAPDHPQLLVGPGDDAAVLRLGEARLVFTTDLLCDGVHFRRDAVEAGRVGRKTLAVNLSDLAAMAALPLAAVISVALPQDEAEPLAHALFEGIAPLAEKHDVAIAGGDTNTWDGPLVINVALLGTIGKRGPLLRSGAVPGDILLATGEFGGSLLGLQYDFEPRVKEALRLHENYELHAGIDCSDGLSLDASRIAAASNCGLAIDVEAVPISAAAHELANRPGDGKSALDHALSDGEDFELLLAVPPDEAERLLAEQPLEIAISRLGEFVAEPGLWQLEDGSRVPLTATGFEH